MAENDLSHKALAAENDGQGMMRVEAFSGILPHPEFVRQYEASCPGIADRIMRLAELEAERRHEKEMAASRRDDVLADTFQEESRASVQEKHRGQWFGFGLGISCVAGALWTSSTPLAIALCTTSVGFILSAFLGKRKDVAVASAPSESQPDAA